MFTYVAIKYKEDTYMKTFKLFGYVIEIRKENERKELEQISIQAKSETVYKNEGQSLKEEQIDLTDAPQLVKDAYKCSKCWNTKYCACNRVAKYLLEVGIDVFKEQAQRGTFPDRIKEAVKAMDYNLIFAYEVDPEYDRILKIAKGSWLK